MCLPILSTVHSNKRDNTDTETALAAVRELRSNEKYIDYFISHSWHDDAQAKFAILDRVKQQFKAKYKREATFWLDKVCIDQENISDGLQVLCINVTACKKLPWYSWYAARRTFSGCDACSSCSSCLRFRKTRPRRSGSSLFQSRPTA